MSRDGAMGSLAYSVGKFALLRTASSYPTLSYVTFQALGLLPLKRHAVGPGAGESAARVPDGHGHCSGDETAVPGVPKDCHGFDGRSDRELLVLAARVGLDL